MTTLKQHKYIKKAISMNITAQQISIQLTKTQMTAVLAEAMADPVANQAIKRVLNPFLAGAFEQFPQYTVVLLGETTEDGTECILKQPAPKRAPKADKPASDKSLDSMEEHTESATEEPDTDTDIAVA